MDITYFNWHELLSTSRKQNAAIICLAYGISSSYNVKTIKELRFNLNLQHIPQFLFQKRHFIQIYEPKKLLCNFVVSDPQSYYKNPKFLTDRSPIRDKLIYLRALSMRRPTSKDNFIPRYYYPNVPKNMYLEITEDKIYFPLESSL